MTKTPAKVPYPTPGEILEEEFLKPFGITHYRLAKQIGVQQRRVDEIVNGTRSITPDTALRLSRFFGLSDSFWIHMQAGYDTRNAKAELADVLKDIEPFKIAKARAA